MEKKIEKHLRLLGTLSVIRSRLLGTLNPNKELDFWLLGTLSVTKSQLFVTFSLPRSRLLVTLSAFVTTSPFQGACMTLFSPSEFFCGYRLHGV